MKNPSQNSRSPTPGRIVRPLGLAAPALALVFLLAAGCRPDPAADTEATATPQAAVPGDTSAPAGEGGPQPAPSRSAPVSGTAWIIFGADTVVAELARTPEERRQGLMGREEVPAGTGMLFMYDRAEPRSFWMENTLVDLDIAFMDPGFRILEIHTMEAGSSEFTRSRSPAQFALEVPAGWFAEQGITEGAVPAIVFGR